jgi:hypothetical protein
MQRGCKPREKSRSEATVEIRSKAKANRVRPKVLYRKPAAGWHIGVDKESCWFEGETERQRAI